MDTQIHWNPGMSLAEVEKQVIQKCLEFYRGNKSQTSRVLGISIRYIDKQLLLYSKQAEEQKVREMEELRRAQDKLARMRGHIPPDVLISNGITPSPFDPRVRKQS